MSKDSSTNAAVVVLCLAREAVCSAILVTYIALLLALSFVIGVIFRLVGLSVTSHDLGGAQSDIDGACRSLFRAAGLAIRNSGDRA